jgi:hypothetical protein
MCRSTFPYLGSNWSWVVSVTPRPRYPRRKRPGTHWKGGWVRPRAGLDDVENVLPLPGLELRPVRRAARSQSLYRLRYPFSLVGEPKIPLIPKPPGGDNLDPIGVSPVFFSKGTCLTSVIALANGTSTSSWNRHFCFRSRQRTAFIPLWLDLALLFPNCSLLRAVRLKRRGPFAGAPPSMCFCDRWYAVIVTSTSLEGFDWHSRFSAVDGLGTRPYEDIHRFQGRRSGTSSSPVVARDASTPRMHRGRAWRRVSGSTLRWYWRRTHKLSVGAAPEPLLLKLP